MARLHTGWTNEVLQHENMVTSPVVRPKPSSNQVPGLGFCFRVEIHARVSTLEQNPRPGPWFELGLVAMYLQVLANVQI